jgi:cell division protein FtsB
MTVRRGSVGFTISRMAAKPFSGGSRKHRERTMLRWMSAAGRALVLATVLLIAASFSVQAWRVGYQNYQLHKQIDAIEQQNDKLAADSVQLNRAIILSRNPEYLVPLIHEQLGLTKPGEVFIQIAPAATK